MIWVLYFLATILIFASANWYVLPLENWRCWVGTVGMAIGVMMVFSVGVYKGERNARDRDS